MSMQILLSLLQLNNLQDILYQINNRVMDLIKLIITLNLLKIKGELKLMC